MHETSIFLPISEAYDKWSQTYDTYDNPMVCGASRAVEFLGPAVRNSKVFEFGCGTGRNLLVMKRLGAAEATGCDLSPGMLAEAQRRDPTLRLYQHDMAQPLPLDEGSMDCALFCLSLEHLADLVPPLREARRLLRRMGRIEIIEIHPQVSMSGVAAHFRHCDQVVRMPTFAHSFSDYLNAFAELELRVSACREWRPRDFSDVATDKMLKRGADHPLLVQFTLLAKTS